MAAPMSPALLDAVAGRFKALAEPARLRILERLRHGRLHVNALVAATGLQQANLSRHLQTLHTQGFVVRTREGTFVYYAVADPQVFALCDLMCGQVERAAHTRSVRLKRRTG
jgi:DNA-binding transcriptional ArsR family regulator